MASVLLSPYGVGQQFFDDNGNPLAGGLIYTYQSGSSTPLATYTDSGGTIANSNPIVLDSAGRAPSEIWMFAGYTYKFIIKTSADVLMPYSFKTSNIGFDGETIPSTALHCLLDIVLASFLEINCGMNGK